MRMSTVPSVAAGFSDARATHERQSFSDNPDTGSISMREIASGDDAATVSISTPPCALNSPRNFFAERSSVNDA